MYTKRALGRHGPRARTLSLASLLLAVTVLSAACGDNAADENLDGTQTTDAGGGDLGVDEDAENDDVGTGDIGSPLTPPSSPQHGLAATAGQSQSSGYQMTFRVAAMVRPASSDSYQLHSGAVLVPAASPATPEDDQ